MTETQHTPTELERLGEEPLPSADELAGRFPLTQNPNPTSQSDYEKAMEELNFGTVFTFTTASLLSKVSRPTVTLTAVFGRSVPASMPRV